MNDQKTSSASGQSPDPADELQPACAPIMGAGEDCHELGETLPAATLNGGEIQATPTQPQDVATEDTETAIPLPTDALAGLELPLSAPCLKGDSRLNDRFIDLRIVVSAAEAEAANAADPHRVTIAEPGLLSWQPASDGSSVRTLEPIEARELDVTGRHIRICLPSDFRHTTADQEALEGRALDLRTQGAKTVSIEVMPHGQDGASQTLTDVIGEQGEQKFRYLSRAAKPCFKEVSGKTKYFLDPEPERAWDRSLYLGVTITGDWKWVSETKTWWWWTGHSWEAQQGEGRLEKDVDREFENQQWRDREPATIRNVVAVLKRSNLSPTPQAAKGLVYFRNGCLRGSDGLFIAHDPGHGNTWNLPYDHDPGAIAPDVVAFLRDRLGSDENLALYRAFGRALLLHTRLKVFLEVYGPGDTGKTVLVNLLTAAVGAARVTASRLELLEDRGQRFQTHKLRGKAMVVFSEAQGYHGSLEVLKSLTGGDRINSEKKGSNEEVDFVFDGVVVVVGNGPIGSTDPSGAVFNRRRSIHIEKVVPLEDRRPLLGANADGSWSGEFVGQLPGLANWFLGMTDAEASKALERPAGSEGEVERRIETMMTGDFFLAWVEEQLVFAPGAYARVGTTDNEPSTFLYANYRNAHREHGETAKPVPLRVFKQKLIEFLRDGLNLGLPNGLPTSGAYRMRNEGSIVPMIRLRTPDEGLASKESPGVIRYAWLERP